ncbi:hypothetical protein AB4Z17_19840 [Paenibacillus sp. TAF43_2]|uniref:hypothetical protein n=1 Tax=Paenibacillus sp. TAF43_2 TaxID=3233069 RepID=UPI003F95CB6B
MEVDFSAVFKHSLDVTAIEVFKEEIVKGIRFPKVVKCMKEVNFHNPHLDRQWLLNRDRISESYNIEPFDPVLIGDEEYVELGGPGGFRFIFNKYICEFSPCFRWHQFIENQELQLELRAICQEFADYFGYNFAIYMGDNYCALDYVFEGRNMDYYKAKLMSRFGKAKLSIGELIQKTNSGWESEGYFIDDFNDLQRNSLSYNGER